MIYRRPILKTEVKTEVERLEEEKDTVLLKVEVPTNVFDAAVGQAYKRIADQLVVPGFRKGKIPKAIIDSRVGKEAVREEALEQALPHYYMDALKESDIEPVDQPEVDIVQAEEGKPLIFTAKVKVKPEVKLGKYTGLEVDKPSSEPSDGEISSQLDGLRNNFANLEPVENRPIKEGDFALIDFEGFSDGEPFEGGQANDYMLEIGSGTFIPGFEEQIAGMKKGEAKDIKVTFPEDYGNDQLAGKEATFKVAVKEIKEKKLPELSDDFAKQVGFDTLDDLRADIREKIYEVKSKYADAEVKGEIVDAVTDLSQAEVHEVMIEQEIDDMLEDFAGDVKRQGLDLDQYLELTGMTKEALRGDWHDRARHRVKSRMVVEAVAEAENIEVTPEEVDNEINKAAEATGRDFEEVKHIFEMKGSIGALKKRILISKAIDWLVERSVITEKEAKEAAEEAEETTEASEAGESNEADEASKPEVIEEQ